MRGFCGVLGLTGLCAAGLAQGPLPDQYPKPLIHTAADHPAARVILIDVDGLHAVDLARWVGDHPKGALAALSGRGVTYTNAHSPWTDGAAGLVGLVSGGTPVSTGIVSSDGWDRKLSPAGSGCKAMGAAIDFKAMVDAQGNLDAAKLPLDASKGCAMVWPHDLMRVNTIFEVAHEKVGRTAWAGDDAARTDLLRGPSGKGLDEACGFAAGPEAGDEARVAAVVHWVEGKDCAGTKDAAVPALFGMSFTGIGRAQAEAGYRDGGEAMSDALAKSFAALDAALGRVMAELKAKKLNESTWIVVTAAYGQSPMDRALHRLIELVRVRGAAEGVKGGSVAHVSGGDVALVWLKDSNATAVVVKAFHAQAEALGIAEVYSGARLALTLNSPGKDARMPDIVLQPKAGVLWGEAGDQAVAAHGGLTDEDTHVALLVSGPQFVGREDKTLVPTTQLAPLLLRSFGMEKFDLWALHPEHTPALPGIF